MVCSACFWFASGLHSVLFCFVLFCFVLFCFVLNFCCCCFDWFRLVSLRKTAGRKTDATRLPKEKDVINDRTKVGSSSLLCPMIWNFLGRASRNTLTLPFLLSVRSYCKRYRAPRNWTFTSCSAFPASSWLEARQCQTSSKCLLPVITMKQKQAPDLPIYVYVGHTHLRRARRGGWRFPLLLWPTRNNDLAKSFKRVSASYIYK